jgi:hypothetical protein
MPEETFVTFIERERARLHTAREQIFNQQQTLEATLADINRELAAIDAMKQLRPASQPAQPVRDALQPAAAVASASNSSKSSKPVAA